MNETRHITRPWLRHFEDRHTVEQIGELLIGRSLGNVSYLLPDGSFCSESGPVHFDGFDFVSHVSMGIELETVCGRVYSIIWMTQGSHDGMLDGVSIGSGRATNLDATSHHGRNFVSCDVTDTPGWRSILNSQVVDVGFAWQGTESEDYISVWALRLDFADARSVVIALGEVDDFSSPTITPSVDHLVVIFEMDIAKSYKPLAAETSAIGE